jgi:hypothetical protein
MDTVGTIGNRHFTYTYAGVSRWGGEWGVTPPQSWKILFFLVVNFKNFVKNLRKLMKFFLKNRLNPQFFQNFLSFSENFQNFSGNSRSFSENSQNFSENSQNFSENFQNFLHPPNFLDFGTPLYVCCVLP